jgi:hypothetical protein
MASMGPHFRNDSMNCVSVSRAGTKSPSLPRFGARYLTRLAATSARAFSLGRFRWDIGPLKHPRGCQAPGRDPPSPGAAALIARVLD